MALIGCERSGSTKPPKIHKKVPPLHEKGRRWHVKKKIRKNFEKKRLLFLRLFSLVLVEMWKYRLFLRDYNVLRQYKVPLHASDYPIVAPPKLKFFLLRDHFGFI